MSLFFNVSYQEESEIAQYFVVQVIERDERVVRPGDIVNWRARGLAQNETYRVGIWVEKENKVYDPVTFKATNPPDKYGFINHSGTYTVPYTVPPGDHWFVLQRYFPSGWLTADSKPITVTTAPTVEPKLSLDKTTYYQHDIASWKATNLKIGYRYKVGTMKDNKSVVFYYTNEFTAGSSSQSGFHLITEPPGKYDFVLIEGGPVLDRIVDKIPIEVIQRVKEKPPEEKPEEKPEERPHEEVKKPPIKRPEEKKGGVSLGLIILGGVATAVIGGMVYYFIRQKRR
jgi:hypothetical protein